MLVTDGVCMWLQFVHVREAWGYLAPCWFSGLRQLPHLQLCWFFSILMVRFNYRCSLNSIKSYYSDFRIGYISGICFFHLSSHVWAFCHLWIWIQRSCLERGRARRGIVGCHRRISDVQLRGDFPGIVRGWIVREWIVRESVHGEIVLQSWHSYHGYNLFVFIQQDKTLPSPLECSRWIYDVLLETIFVRRMFPHFHRYVEVLSKLFTWLDSGPVCTRG